MVASGRTSVDGSADNGGTDLSFKPVQPLLKPRTASVEERDDWLESIRSSVQRVPTVNAAFRFTAPSKSQVAAKFGDRTATEINELYDQAMSESLGVGKSEVWNF